jgi:hypothetical protein
MSITQNNWRALLEEETLSEFINVVDYAKKDSIEDEGIFYCQNGY